MVAKRTSLPLLRAGTSFLLVTEFREKPLGRTGIPPYQRNGCGITPSDHRVCGIGALLAWEKSGIAYE